MLQVVARNPSEVALFTETEQGLRFIASHFMEATSINTRLFLAPKGLGRVGCCSRLPAVPAVAQTLGCRFWKASPAGPLMHFWDGVGGHQGFPGLSVGSQLLTDEGLPTSRPSLGVY